MAATGSGTHQKQNRHGLGSVAAGASCARRAPAAEAHLRAGVVAALFAHIHQQGSGVHHLKDVLCAKHLGTESKGETRGRARRRRKGGGRQRTAGAAVNSEAIVGKRRSVYRWVLHPGAAWGLALAQLPPCSAGRGGGTHLRRGGRTERRLPSASAARPAGSAGPGRRARCPRGAPCPAAAAAAAAAAAGRGRRPLAQQGQEVVRRGGAGLVPGSPCVGGAAGGRQAQGAGASASQLRGPHGPRRPCHRRCERGSSHAGCSTGAPVLGRRGGKNTGGAGAPQGLIKRSESPERRWVVCQIAAEGLSAPSSWGSGSAPCMVGF